MYVLCNSQVLATSLFYPWDRILSAIQTFLPRYMDIVPENFLPRIYWLPDKRAGLMDLGKVEAAQIKQGGSSWKDYEQYGGSFNPKVELLIFLQMKV